MTSPTPTQVHHTVGNDLGGTQRPSGQLGWGGLAFFIDAGCGHREETIFQQLTRLMGEADLDSKNIANEEVGGLPVCDRNQRSVINCNQRTGKVVRRVGGLAITPDPVLSKQCSNVVFTDQEVPGGSN